MFSTVIFLELLNQTIKNGLRKLCDNEEQSWVTNINRILFGLRIHVPRVTKFSAFELVYGFKARMRFDNYLSQDDVPTAEQVYEQDAEAKTEDEDLELVTHVSGVLERFQKLSEERAKARSNILKEQAQQKQAYKVKHEPLPFATDDLVLLQNTRNRTRKGGVLNSNFSGPYKVMQITKNSRVVLADMNGNKLKGRSGEFYL